MSARSPEKHHTGLPFEEEEYNAWFDHYSKGFLEPARASAVQALKQLLDRELPEPDRTRVRVRDGRVKSKLRTWRKLHDKYVDQVSSTADIPKVVDDLVGLRIVCTNKSDLERVVEILEGIDEYSEADAPVLATVRGKARDWVTTPKPSGYRAFHVNLCTSIARATERHVVVCELQVRTLLQDSWGELTHEDTYKPGGAVPQLIETLSKRMSDLMATLDDIAQDLRTVLDKQQELGLEQPSAATSTSRDRDTSGNIEAAKRYLAERVRSLERPIDFASLAWELQREFGQEIVEGWLGYGTFKRLLTEAVPDARVSPRPPSYVLPSDFNAASYGGEQNVPRAVSLLNDADRSFPLVGTEYWPRIYGALAQALQRVNWVGRADIRTVNELTRAARDAAAMGDGKVTRRQVGYVTRALLFAAKLQPKLGAAEIERFFVEWTVDRAEGMELPREDLQDLESWLQGTWKEPDLPT